MSGARALVEVAAEVDWPTVLAAEPRLLDDALHHACWLPEALVEAVLAGADPVARGWLAGNATRLRERPDLVQRLAATGEPEVFRMAVTTTQVWTPRQVSRLLAAAGPEVHRLLRDGRLPARAGGTEELIADLRAARGPLGIEDRVDLHETVDWPAVLAEHRREPFNLFARAALVARPECPAEVALSLLESDVTDDPKDRLWNVSERELAPAARLVRRRLSAGATPGFLLDRVHPAAFVLEAARLRPNAEPAAGHWDELTARLRSLVSGLGDDPDRWRALRTRLEDFPGTVTALFEPESRDATPLWPDGAEVAPPELVTARPPALTTVRAAFVTLLNLAGTGTQLALLPLLDEQTGADLLVYGEWRDGWVDHVVAHGTLAQRVSLASRWGLDDEVVDRLGALDLPLVNGALFIRQPQTVHRGRLLSGRSWDAARDEPVPLDRAWVSVFLSYVDTRGLATPRSPLVRWRVWDVLDCTDRWILFTVLREHPLIGSIPKLRLLANVWRRLGREGVEWLLTFKATEVGDLAVLGTDFRPVADRMRELLARPDEAAARAELEAEVAEGASAQWQEARLRAGNTDRLKETHRWRWPELASAHRRAPFSDQVLAAIWDAQRSQQGVDAWWACPEDFRLAAETAPRWWVTEQEAALRRGVPIEHVLADLGIEAIARPGQRERNGYDWIRRALRAGRVTWRQVFEHARPADAALELLLAFTHHPVNVRRAHPDLRSGHQTLAPLFAETVGSDAEALIRALRRLPDTSGSVVSLLRHARGPVQLRDVASYAGVELRTAVHAFNVAERVPRDVWVAVHHAADALGYEARMSHPWLERASAPPRDPDPPVVTYRPIELGPDEWTALRRAVERDRPGFARRFGRGTRPDQPPRTHAFGLPPDVDVCEQPWFAGHRILDLRWPFPPGHETRLFVAVDGAGEMRVLTGRLDNLCELAAADPPGGLDELDAAVAYARHVDFWTRVTPYPDFQIRSFDDIPVSGDPAVFDTLRRRWSHRIHPPMPHPHPDGWSLHFWLTAVRRLVLRELIVPPDGRVRRHDTVYAEEPVLPSGRYWKVVDGRMVPAS